MAKKQKSKADKERSVIHERKLKKRKIIISIALLLVVPLVLIIFGLQVFDPFEYKKFLIQAKKDLTALAQIQQQEDSLIRSDNSDRSDLITYYAVILDKIDINKTFIESGSFSKQTATGELKKYYTDLQNITLIKKEQAVLLDILVQSDNINVQTTDTLASFDKFTDIGTSLQQTTTSFTNLQNTINNLTPITQNTNLYSALKKYITSQTDYYSKLSDLAVKAGSAQTKNDLDSLRQILEQIKALSKDSPATEQALLAQINQEIIANQNSLSEFNDKINNELNNIDLEFQKEISLETQV